MKLSETLHINFTLFIKQIEDTEDEMKSQDKVKELVKESVAADMVCILSYTRIQSSVYV